MVVPLLRKEQFHPNALRQLSGCKDKENDSKSTKEHKTRTSATIIWQSKVPLPPLPAGLGTCDRTAVTTGAPNVMFGTKWPSIMSICSQSAPWRSMVSEHSAPRRAKSADRMEGAIIGGGCWVGGPDDILSSRWLCSRAPTLVFCTGSC
jgi:hypothetical protein